MTVPADRPLWFPRVDDGPVRTPGRTHRAADSVKRAAAEARVDATLWRHDGISFLEESERCACVMRGGRTCRGSALPFCPCCGKTFRATSAVTTFERGGHRVPRRLSPESASSRRLCVSFPVRELRRQVLAAGLRISKDFFEDGEPTRS